MNIIWALGGISQSNVQNSSILSEIEKWYDELIDSPSAILAKADSVLSNQSLELSDLEKTYLHHIKSDCYYYLDDLRASDESIKIAISIAPENFHTAKLVDMYNSHGQNLDYLGDSKLAIQSYKTGLQLATQIKDSISIGNLHYNIGLCYYSLSNFETALKYIDSSQTMSIASRDSNGLSSILRLQSNIFTQYGDIDRAIASSYEGIRYSTNDDPELRCLHYLDIANTYYKNNELDSMYKYAMLGKKCSDKNSFGQSKIEVFKTIGNYYRLAKDTTNAILYYDTLITLSEKMGAIRDYYHGKLSKYTFVIDENQLEEAIKILNDAENLGFDRLTLQAYHKISKLLYDKGRKDEAYKYLYKSNRLQDKYNREDNRRQMEIQAARFKLEEKEIQTQIAEQKLKTKQAQFLTYSILGASIFLAFIGWLSYRNKRSKFLLNQEKLQKEAELLREIADVESQAFRAQMNPHFIFNALNSIKGLIINKQEKDAAIYISKFSKLVRNVLDYSRSKTILLSDEITTLEMYIKLEQMRFRDGFQYNIRIDNRLEPDSIYIPPITIQPFVENAIWHGFKNNKRENKLDIEITQRNEDLIISIQDNGVGRKNTTKQKDRVSHGVSITKQRILNFSGDQNTERLVFNDLIDDNGNALGTSVLIKIPIKYHSYD